MRRHEFNAVFRAIQQMSWSQRRQLMAGLKSVQASEQAHRIVEERVQWLASCPHGCGLRIVRNGMARGLQRYKCRDCGRTFNALSGTPLARLRYRDRWLDQAQALIDGLSITRASQQLEVARSTAFRWRHRFLSLPQHLKSGHLSGIVEADETCTLKSCKGQPAARRQLRRKPRGRGGRATVGGMSAEQDIVLVVRDRSGACTDQIVAALDTPHLAAVLQPVLATDAVLCTDGSPALAAAARCLEVEHHAINLSAGQRVIGPWHINNVNGYHGRLKNWLRRFKGVASSYLQHYLGWFRALERFRPAQLTPPALLALAIGI
jgi:transposase-like protein